VFVTGATGVIGRPAVAALVAAGHAVTGVARTDAAARGLADAGARPVTVDLFDAAAVRDAVAGHDTVVHLATSIPPMRDMRRGSAWVTNGRLRVDATRALVDAARVHGVDRFVKESITFPYLDGGDAWLDEDAPLDPSPTWQPTLVGEDVARSFADADGSVVVLRFGSLYAREARSTEEYRRLARLRIAPVPGAPDGFVSSIHADDAATAVVAALGAPAGTYNVVDDRPLRRREHAAAVAAAFGVRRLHVAPAAPLRWIGGGGARGLTASQRVSNRALRDATGWQPRWADAVAGWASLFAEHGAEHGAGQEEVAR
jgi:nucleoside-diphosphate-sugar epimerase